LGHHRFEDGQNPSQGVQRPQGVIVDQPLLQIIQFVQNLLEPKLVNLVDDNKQHLIVFRTFGQRLLSRQNLIQL
jgi:hypothetical protein